MLVTIRNTVNNQRRALIWATATLLGLMTLCGLYALSVAWRVSEAELAFLGRSDFIPLGQNTLHFDQPATSASFGAKTFQFKNPAGKTITVWKQKINGFQHVYGSALTCQELGEKASTLLFCLNEYAEPCPENSPSYAIEILERKKDLANNALGRELAMAAAQSRKTELAESVNLQLHRAKSLAEICADALESDPRFLSSNLDPRVKQLDENKLGCDCLPGTNLFK